jgi:hypothetical protein
MDDKLGPCNVLMQKPDVAWSYSRVANSNVSMKKPMRWQLALHSLCNCTPCVSPN